MHLQHSVSHRRRFTFQAQWKLLRVQHLVIRVEQTHLEVVVLDRILAAWFDEATLTVLRRVTGPAGAVKLTVASPSPATVSWVKTREPTTSPSAESSVSTDWRWVTSAAPPDWASGYEFRGADTGADFGEFSDFFEALFGWTVRQVDLTASSISSCPPSCLWRPISRGRWGSG